MIIGIPKEIKKHEYRVGATPELVKMLAEHGHQVIVQTQAGKTVGFSDDAYRSSGAHIAMTRDEVYQSDMIVKVKELQQEEFPLLHKGQILFCYMHLAPDPVQTKHLVEKEIVGIAYETVVDAKGRLPLLTPMSEIAGRLSIQVGATALQINQGGKGVLLGGIPGVPPAHVVIIGGGVSGTEAARMAMGAGAKVTVLDKDLYRLRALDSLYGREIETLVSSSETIAKTVKMADLVVGAVLIPGKTAPKLVTKEMVRQMSPGSVIVDLSIDQGGCVETSRPTNHDSPTFVAEGVIHYCVTNMPGVCGLTATLGLTQATSDYVLAIADDGYAKAMRDDPILRSGLNVCLGKVTNENVANDLDYPFTPPNECL